MFPSSASGSAPSTFSSLSVSPSKLYLGLPLFVSPSPLVTLRSRVLLRLPRSRSYSSVRAAFYLFHGLSVRSHQLPRYEPVCVPSQLGAALNMPSRPSEPSADIWPRRLMREAKVFKKSGGTLQEWPRVDSASDSTSKQTSASTYLTLFSLSPTPSLSLSLPD